MKAYLALIFLVGCGLSLGQAVPADPLAAYSSCKLADGPEVIETAPLAGGVKSRSVQTLQGMRSIAMEFGKRVMFSYPGGEFYANVKAERLPTAGYDEEKKWLIDNFEFILSGKGDNERNYALKPKLHRFEIYGLDRGKLEGGVLGIYLFFNDSKHEVVTIYFLNQGEATRNFKTIAEYRQLKDHFLEAYTSCLSTQK